MKINPFLVRNICNLISNRRIRYHIAKRLYNYENSDLESQKVLVKYFGGLNIRVSINEIIGWNIFFLGQYEPEINDLLRKYLKQGDIVIEAGANIGTETLLISNMIGKDGKVYGFEPFPRVYNELKYNLEINQLTNVKAIDMALGHLNCIVDFNIMDDDHPNQGMSSLIKTGHSKSIKVKQVTLDDYVEENDIKIINLIKMDIQGAEINLLNGANNTISQFKPIIILEATAPWSDVRLLYNSLTSYGYDIFNIDYNMKHLAELNIIDGNWICLPKK